MLSTVAVKTVSDRQEETAVVETCVDDSEEAAVELIKPVVAALVNVKVEVVKGADDIVVVAVVVVAVEDADEKITVVG